MAEATQTTQYIIVRPWAGRVAGEVLDVSKIDPRRLRQLVEQRKVRAVEEIEQAQESRSRKRGRRN